MNLHEKLKEQESQTICPVCNSRRPEKNKATVCGACGTKLGGKK